MGRGVHTTTILLNDSQRHHMVRQNIEQYWADLLILLSCWGGEAPLLLSSETAVQHWRLKTISLKLLSEAKITFYLSKGSHKKDQAWRKIAADTLPFTLFTAKSKSANPEVIVAKSRNYSTNRMFSPKKLAPNTRDLRHFQIHDKTA